MATLSTSAQVLIVGCTGISEPSVFKIAPWSTEGTSVLFKCGHNVMCQMAFFCVTVFLFLRSGTEGFGNTHKLNPCISLVERAAPCFVTGRERCWQSTVCFLCFPWPGLSELSESWGKERGW